MRKLDRSHTFFVQTSADDVDMDPEAWLAAQPDIDTSLDFDGVDGVDDSTDKRANERDGKSATSSAEETSEDSLKSRAAPGITGAAAGALGRASRDVAAAVARGSSMASEGIDALAGGGWEVEDEEEEEEEKLVVCQRCHKLRFYGGVEESLRPGFSDSDLLTPQRFLVSFFCNKESCVECTLCSIPLICVRIYVHTVTMERGLHRVYRIVPLSLPGSSSERILQLSRPVIIIARARMWMGAC